MLSRPKARLIWKTAFLPLLDFLALMLGAALVYLVRYRWFDQAFSGNKEIYGADYFQYSLLFCFSVIVIYAFLGLYRISQKVSALQTVIGLTLGIWIVLLSLITFFFFNEYNQSALPQGVQISRFVLGAGGFFALFCVFFARSLLWLIEQVSYSLGFNRMNVAVIGGRSKLLHHLRAKNSVREIFEYEDLHEDSLQTLENLMRHQQIDEMYVFSNPGRLERELSHLAERYKVSYIFCPPDLDRYESWRLQPTFLYGYHFFQLIHTPLDGWLVVLKRLFDLVFSICFLAAFSWLYLILAILIKLDSPGSVFYLSERVGPNGQVFKLWKFRRFKQEFCTSELSPASKAALEYEEQLILEQGEVASRGALYKIKNDPRMTRMGRFLEKTSLDELPQFINVLMGNMSIVGPRPHQPREVKKYEKHHFIVLNIQPGITGMAQVNGRSDLNFEEEIKYDTFYVHNWSFALDLWIILKTPYTILFKRHKQ